MSLKATNGEMSKEDEDMTYITKRFLKVMRRIGGFQIRENLSRSATAIDLS